MGVLKEFLAGAVGYGIASAKNSKVVGDIIDNNISSKSLEDLIQNYAFGYKECHSLYSGVVMDQQPSFHRAELFGRSRYSEISSTYLSYTKVAPDTFTINTNVVYL